MAKRKRSWTEAPLFHLAGLLFSACGFLWAVLSYVDEASEFGWYNEQVPGVVIYGLILVYFVCGCRSGLGEAEAVEEVLEREGRQDG